MLCGLTAVVVAEPAAPVIRNVRVEREGAQVGLKHGIRRGDVFSAGSIDSVCRAVSRRLSELGFLWNHVSWDTSGRQGLVDVRLVVLTGAKARLAGWRVVGDSAGEALAQEVLSRSGAEFRRTVLEQTVARVVAACENAGYPFARVRATALDESIPFVMPTLAVNAGEMVRVDFLESSEPQWMNNRVLERAARFRGRRAFSPAAIQTWRRNILRTGWARSDSEQVIISAKGHGVRFFVSADRANRAEIAAGYVPGDRWPTGYVRLAFLNLLNTCRRLTAGWQSLTGRTSYELSYAEPWLLNSELEAVVSVRHTTLDTSYSHTEVGVGTTVLRGALDFTVEAGIDRTAGSDSLSRANTTWVGSGVRIDLRDNQTSPQKGIMAALRTRAGQRKVVTGTGLAGRIEADVHMVLPLCGRIAGSVGAAGRGVLARVKLVEPELCRLGGGSSVRGFRDGQFLAAQVGWLNCELRYGLAADTRVYPFLDVGAYLDSGSWHLIAGYGAGVRWQTRVGRLGVDYGIALRDSPLRGKVHLSLVAGF